MSLPDVTSRPNKVAMGDLDPLDDLAHSAPRPELQSLPDTELLAAVLKPKNNDGLLINARTGKLFDRNGRAWELIRWSADPSSSISPETLVPVDAGHKHIFRSRLRCQ